VLIEAFVLDYLLKPVKPERLAKTLDRIKERFPEKSRQPAQPPPPQAQLSMAAEELSEYM